MPKDQRLRGQWLDETVGKTTELASGEENGDKSGPETFPFLLALRKIDRSTCVAPEPPLPGASIGARGIS